MNVTATFELSEFSLEVVIPEPIASSLEVVAALSWQALFVESSPFLMALASLVPLVGPELGDSLEKHFAEQTALRPSSDELALVAAMQVVQAQVSERMKPEMSWIAVELDGF